MQENFAADATGNGQGSTWCSAAVALHGLVGFMMLDQADGFDSVSSPCKQRIKTQVITG